MMFSQQNWSRVVGDFRPSRKCFSFYGSLLFLVVCICIAQQAAGRPSQDDDLPSNFNMDDEFRDVDNLEIHHVRVVDGVAAEEDHPIIMYKEDFVSEDYVPSKNETKSGKPKRKYKDISHRRRHKQNTTEVLIEEKPENILFDIIPETPLIVPEDLEKPRKTRMKLIPLSEDVSEAKDSNEESAVSKSSLNKRPKKFHRRVRRDADGEHIVRKRNPYFRHLPKIAGEVPISVQYIYVKHSVPGKKHNGLDIPVTKAPTKPDPNTIEPISFDNRVAADEDDRVIFSGGKTTPRPTRKPAGSIFRDPRPENFDYSFMNPQSTTTTRMPIFTRRPETTRSPQSIFRDPRPENFDFSFMNQGQQTQQSPVVARPVTAAPAASAPSSQTISHCVWAIVNCCSNRNSQLRYSCFEENGCYGAFWDINPCADNVRDNVVGFVADYYN